jgi:hypothetical protein
VSRLGDPLGPWRGTATCRHELPFQCGASASGLRRLGLLTSPPTAHASRGLTTATPTRTPSALPSTRPGPGVGTIVHLTPFQCSMRVFPGLPSAGLGQTCQARPFPETTATVATTKPAAVERLIATSRPDMTTHSEREEKIKIGRSNGPLLRLPRSARVAEPAAPESLPSSGWKVSLAWW